MAYTAISDFKYGMDRRRPQESGVPGTLWILKNGLITRGGDIERAKKFVATETLPAGTFGLFSVRGQRYVFGSATEPPGMPTGIKYIRLQAPGGIANMTRILDARGFDGKLYAIAAYDDGNIFHFYNSERVVAWDALADSAATLKTVAARIADLLDAQSAYIARAYENIIEITAATPGTPFTLGGSTADFGNATNPTLTPTLMRANVVAVTEVRATATVTITGGTSSPNVNKIAALTADGVALLDTYVDWGGSNDATANALAVEINNSSSVHGYIADAAGAVVTITAKTLAGEEFSLTTFDPWGADDTLEFTSTIEGDYTVKIVDFPDLDTEFVIPVRA